MAEEDPDYKVLVENEAETKRDGVSGHDCMGLGFDFDMEERLKEKFGLLGR